MQDTGTQALQELMQIFVTPAPRRTTMMYKKKARDNQRSKVYTAETSALGGKPPTWKQLSEVEKWIDRKFYKSVRMQKKYPMFARTSYRVELRPGKGRRSACARPGMHDIALPLWARSEWVVCHELAHLVVGSRDGAWHDWRFCEVYLDLVRHSMGKDAHDKLKASFKRHNVKFTAPRPKRQLSEDQKAVLRERIAKAREAKLAKAEEAL